MFSNCVKFSIYAVCVHSVQIIYSNKHKNAPSRTLRRETELLKDVYSYLTQTEWQKEQMMIWQQPF